MSCPVTGIAEAALNVPEASARRAVDGRRRQSVDVVVVQILRRGVVTLRLKRDNVGGIGAYLTIERREFFVVVRRLRMRRMVFGVRREAVPVGIDFVDGWSWEAAHMRDCVIGCELLKSWAYAGFAW